MIRELLKKKINEHKRSAESLVIGGHVEDFSSYKYLVGKIRGLEDALAILNELIYEEIDE